MTKTDASEHVVSQGTLYNGSSRLDYYVTVPAPTQWIAVGVVIESEFEDHRRPRRMLVGEGNDERSAVKDLNSRFGELCARLREFREKTRLAASIADPITASRASDRAGYPGWFGESGETSEREIQH